MMKVKRGREEDGSSIIEDSLEVAESLIQISSKWAWAPQPREPSNGGASINMFSCKTCGRSFTSFQALGGHRASHHKKPKFEEKISDETVAAVKVKAKMIHECSICGIRFGLGQALGGHMRRHRVNSKAGNIVVDDGRHAVVSDDQAAKIVPVLMRSLSKSMRIMCMDLNLTPLENDLQILFGKKAPRVDCKLL